MIPGDTLAPYQSMFHSTVPKIDHFLLPYLSKYLSPTINVDRLSPRLWLASVGIPYSFRLTGPREQE